MKKCVYILTITLLLTIVTACKSEIRKKDFVEKHSYFTEYQKEQALEGNVYIGMPKTSIKSIFGSPNRIEKITNSKEKWSYNNITLIVSKEGLLKNIEN